MFSCPTVGFFVVGQFAVRKKNLTEPNIFFSRQTVLRRKTLEPERCSRVAESGSQFNQIFRIKKRS